VLFPFSRLNNKGRKRPLKAGGKKSLKMEAILSSKTSMDLYISTRRYNPSGLNSLTTVRTLNPNKL
jgi:hypothetical protein